MLQALRKVQLDPAAPPSEYGSEKLEVEVEEKRSIAEPIIDDYPFANQSVISGTYRYRSQPTFGSVETVEGSFEIRTESALLLLEIRADRPSPAELVKEFNEAINHGFAVKRDFVPSRGQVWSFIEMADSIIRLKVRDETGQKKQIQNMEFVEDPSQLTVLNASLRFSAAGGIVVEYSGDTLSVHGAGEDGVEAAVELIESAFREWNREPNSGGERDR